MKGGKGIVVAVFCLWMAGGCQQSVAPHIRILGASPDFLLISLSCLCLMGNRKAGVTLGFAAGLLQGALAGANLTAYVITRTLSGFLIGWFNDLEMEANPVLAFFVTSAVTVFAQLLLLFGAPRGSVFGFLGGTLIGAVTNGVLAIPVYVVLKRILDPPSR